MRRFVKISNCEKFVALDTDSKPQHNSILRYNNLPFSPDKIVNWTVPTHRKEKNNRKEWSFLLLPKVVNIYWTLNRIEGSPPHTLAMNEKGAVKLALCRLQLRCSVSCGLSHFGKNMRFLKRATLALISFTGGCRNISKHSPKFVQQRRFAAPTIRMLMFVFESENRKNEMALWGGQGGSLCKKIRSISGQNPSWPLSEWRPLVPSVRKAFPAESSSAHLPLHTLSMICLRHRKISLRCYIMFTYLQKCHRRVPLKTPWVRRGNSLTLLAVWSLLVVRHLRSRPRFAFLLCTADRGGKGWIRGMRKRENVLIRRERHSCHRTKG